MLTVILLPCIPSIIDIHAATELCIAIGTPILSVRFFSFSISICLLSSGIFGAPTPTNTLVSSSGSLIPASSRAINAATEAAYELFEPLALTFKSFSAYFVSSISGYGTKNRVFSVSLASVFISIG